MSPTSRRVAGAVVSACALLALGSGVANATEQPGEPSAKPVPTNPRAASPVPTVAAPATAEPTRPPTAAQPAPVQTQSRAAAEAPVPAATVAPTDPRSAAPVPATAAPVPVPDELAHTGGDNMTVVYTVAGGALLLMGAGGVFATTRMRGRSTT